MLIACLIIICILFALLTKVMPYRHACSKVLCHLFMNKTYFVDLSINASLIVLTLENRNLSCFATLQVGLFSISELIQKVNENLRRLFDN